MSDELKPFAWCYQTIAGVIVFQKWPASDKEWAQRNNDVAGATKYPNAHSVTDLYTAADLADLRVTNTRLEGDRDRYRATLEEIAKYPPIHPIATAVGDIARAALQEPKT